jgi:hypothetical protein
MVTVQAADPGVGTVTGEQESVKADEDAGTRAREKLAELPLKLATMIAVAPVLTALAWAENVALADPAATLTEEGMVTGAEFAPNERATDVALETADFRLTVQVAVAGVTSGAVLQATLFTVLAEEERMVSVPPVAVAATLVPAADAPTALVS